MPRDTLIVFTWSASTTEIFKDFLTYLQPVEGKICPKNFQTIWCLTLRPLNKGPGNQLLKRGGVKRLSSLGSSLSFLPWKWKQGGIVCAENVGGGDQRGSGAALLRPGTYNLIVVLNGSPHGTTWRIRSMNLSMVIARWTDEVRQLRGPCCMKVKTTTKRTSRVQELMFGLDTVALRPGCRRRWGDAEMDKRKMDQRFMKEDKEVGCTEDPWRQQYNCRGHWW